MKDDPVRVAPSLLSVSEDEGAKDSKVTTRSALLSRARHDLRTPLNAIIGYSELLAEEVDAAAATDLLSEIEKIKSLGTTLLETLNQTLSSMKAWEFSDFVISKQVAEPVYMRMRGLADAVLARSERLKAISLERSLATFVIDLERIRTAAETYGRLADEFYDLLQREIPAEKTRPTTGVLGRRTDEEAAEAIGPRLPTEEAYDGTLLIVDDNPSNRDLLARRLEGLNFWVFVAEDGQTALDIMAEYPFDIVLLDLRMPGMSGYDVLARVKADPSLRQTRIIVTSALDDLESIVACIELGADDYLTKPIDPILLRARLGACLARKRWREQEVEYIRKLAEATEAVHQRKTRELEYARRVQLGLLPKSDVSTSRIEIVGRMITASEVGGDYYDFMELGGTGHFVALGDATGHGVTAGLVVGMTKMGLHIGLHEYAEHRDLRALVEGLNAALKTSLTQRDIGMALATAVVDEETLSVEISSNGIPPPHQFDRERGVVVPLDLKAPPLGFLSRIPVPLQTIQMRPGDALILFSDGFPERFDPAGQQWGYDTVTRELETICSRERSAVGIADALVAACNDFAGDREIDDDMTIVVVRAR